MLAVAGDGRVVLRGADGSYRIYSPDGRVDPIPGFRADDTPILWIDQGRALLTYALDDFTQISRVDLASGTRAVALAAASDPTLLQHGPSSFSRGGRTYAVNDRQITTQLFLVDGLR